MKKFAAVVLAMATIGSVSTVTLANDIVNQAAFAQTVTIKQALNLADDSKVQIKGYVVKALGDEKYQFRDATGSINVEIDDKLWKGKAVSAKTPVTIIGEVDVDHKPTKRVEIDVDQVRF